jgi:hypothetical protein
MEMRKKEKAVFEHNTFVKKREFGENVTVFKFLKCFKFYFFTKNKGDRYVSLLYFDNLSAN